MIVNIVSGSKEVDISQIKKVQADKYIGVDNGAQLLIENDIELDVAIGDFDSISTYQFLNILNSSAEVYKFDSQKDSTDTELAIEHAILLKPDVINLFGVTGRRIDHFLGVLNLFSKVLKHGIKLNIIDPYNKIYVLEPGEYKLKKRAYKYISFFAYFGVVKKLTLKNFKYELTNYDLKNEDTLCVSNEIKDEGLVKFNKGLLLIVESSD